MARKPRFNLVGQPQHVIQRGNNRDACFYADVDYRFYLDCIREAACKFRCEVHAYVLMTNHVHLLVTPRAEHAIGNLMQSVGRRYVRYINSAYRRTGTLWEGRYKSSLIDSERYLLSCYRYIELNPVRAGMVASPAQYRWSSYRYNAVGEEDATVTPHVVYQELGVDPAMRQFNYRSLFSGGMDEALLHDIRVALNQEYVLGSSSFKAGIEQMVRRRVSAGMPGRPPRDKR